MRPSSSPAHPREEAWPTPAQELLLRAALAPGDAALAAWEDWRRRPEAPDRGCARLLPLAASNLGREGASPERIATAREALVASRVRTRFFLDGLRDDVLALGGAGVETVLLKGAALALTCYPEPAARPMADADVLVPRADVDRALDVLAARGFRPRVALPTVRSRVHAISLLHPSRRHLDLHWHALAECRAPDADDGFWSRTRPLAFSGAATRVLAPADQLLLVCVHGLRFCAVPPCRWVADAALLVAAAGADLDWEGLVDEARRRRVVPAALAALLYLRAFDLDVPQAALSALEASPTQGWERLALRARLRAPERRGPLLALVTHYENHARAVESGESRAGARAFLAVAQETWGVPDPWQLPAQALVRGIRRLHRMWATRGGSV